MVPLLSGTENILPLVTLELVILFNYEKCSANLTNATKASLT
jgi:hypothetical protein